MLKVEIKGLPFCPRNRSHASIYNPKTKRSMVVMTEAGRMYEKALNQQLVKYLPEFNDLKDKFNPYKHGLILNYYLGTPDFYTKDKKLSQTSTDLDAHKIMQDVLMKAVGIDDGYIIDTHKTKFNHPTFIYIIELGIVELEELL